MTTIKAYTDLEQSKKLAEILPIESADMHYSKDFDGSWFADLAEYTSVKIPKYVGNIEEHLLPCWSLAALLGILKYPSLTQDVENKWSITDWTGAYPKSEHGFDNPVDACYGMILKLHEFSLL